MVPTGTAPKPDGKVEFGMYTGAACCLEKQFIYEETSTLGAKSLGKSLGDVVQVLPAGAAGACAPAPAAPKAAASVASWYDSGQRL